MARLAICASTLSSWARPSSRDSSSRSSSATCAARRALTRLSASWRQVRRRAPIPGCMSHQAVAPISIADRAITVGPIAGIGSLMSPADAPQVVQDARHKQACQRIRRAQDILAPRLAVLPDLPACEFSGRLGIGGRLPAGVLELADAEVSRGRQGCIKGSPELLLLGYGSLHQSPPGVWIWSAPASCPALASATCSRSLRRARRSAPARSDQPANAPRWEALDGKLRGRRHPCAPGSPH